MAVTSGRPGGCATVKIRLIEGAADGVLSACVCARQCQRQRRLPVRPLNQWQQPIIYAYILVYLLSAKCTVHCVYLKTGQKAKSRTSMALVNVFGAPLLPTLIYGRQFGMVLSLLLPPPPPPPPPPTPPPPCPVSGMMDEFRR